MTSYSDYLPYAFALVLAIPFLVKDASNKRGKRSTISIF